MEEEQLKWSKLQVIKHDLIKNLKHRELTKAKEKRQKKDRVKSWMVVIKLVLSCKGLYKGFRDEVIARDRKMKLDKAAMIICVRYQMHIKKFK